MKVLVTGETGVIGEGTIAALLKRGHAVRLVTRHASGDAGRWPRGVERVEGDLTSAASVRGLAGGCDAIVHLAGIEEETPPDLTYEKVNVLGTRHVVAEAERAKTGRLVFVSSLGAGAGTSRDHESQRRAEQSVRGCARPWVILRPGAVYGPGDGNVSVILGMVRRLPAIPVIDGGDQRFQPLWYEDAGEAIARAADAPDVTGRVLEIAGPEPTTMNDLLDRLERLAGRRPRRVHVPAAFAAMSVHVATLLGFKLPVSQARLTMLPEETVIAPGGENALAAVLGVEPTPLDRGLGKLAGVIPEQLPSEGVGALVRKRYWADIEGAFYRADALRDVFRRNVARVLPFETARENGPLDDLKKNMTFTVNVPLRGALPMRVEDITPTRIVASTLQGHPLAGLLTFDFLERGKQVRFEVGVHARGADLADAVLMALIGELLQDANWRQAVENLVKLSGGRAPAGVQMLVTTLEGEAADEVEEWAARLVVRRMRGRVPPGPPVDGRRRARRGPPPKPAKPRRPRASRSKGRRRAADIGNARRSRAGTGSARTSGRAARPAGGRKAAKRATRSAGRGAAGRAAARSRPRPKASAPKAPPAAATRGTRRAESTGTVPARRAPAKGRRRG
jgi:NADH dehydrogenase